MTSSLASIKKGSLLLDFVQPSAHCFNPTRLHNALLPITSLSVVVPGEVNARHDTEISSGIVLLSGPPFSGKSRLLSHLLSHLTSSSSSCPVTGAVVVFDLDGRFNYDPAGKLDHAGSKMLVIRPASLDQLATCLRMLCSGELFCRLSSCLTTSAATPAIFTVNGSDLVIASHGAHLRQLLCLPVAAVALDGLAAHYWSSLTTTTAGSSSSLQWHGFITSMMRMARDIVLRFDNIPFFISLTSFSHNTTPTAPATMATVDLDGTYHRMDPIWPFVTGADVLVLLNRNRDLQSIDNIDNTAGVKVKFSGLILYAGRKHAARSFAFQITNSGLIFTSTSFSH
ncbi:hypothetical protein V1514DRAFT_317388 [Lipomyces japonicus]|uniref:uncharacterized protein n=1 Tax=Lipomyces japonicus TaxID=56871 RepID=UPI0034CEBE95